MNLLKVLFGLGFLLFLVSAQAQDNAQELRLNELFKINDTALLQKKIAALQKSGLEEDLSLLANYYRAKNDGKQLDEIVTLSLAKFPNGREAFNKAADELYNEPDPQEKVKRYQAFMKRFKNNPKFKDDKFFEYANTFVAFGFAKSQPLEVKVWLDKITDPVYKVAAYSYGARELNNAGNNREAEELITAAIAKVKASQPVDSVALFDYYRLYAAILDGLGKYDEAYTYAKLTYDEVNKPNSLIDINWKDPITQVYNNCLVGTGRYKEVFPMMEQSLKNGTASTLIKDRFKEAYIAVNGSEQGYKAYYDGFASVLRDKLRQEVQHEMVNEPAYNFTLTDAKGKKVTLSDYKGKVVILDFWATWCAPCKASFPLMQLAVNKYKADKDVVFLFVHTWEKSSDPQTATANAVTYLKENKYTFNLLMDLKSPSTKSNDAAVGFGLKGIPTKLILDKNGHIRFKIVGNTVSGEDAFMAHMEAMVTLAKENS